MVRLREDDEVAIRVAQPQLAVTGIRVDVHVGNYIGASVAAPPDDGVEVVGLKPHRDAVAERGVGVGERAVVVRSFRKRGFGGPSSPVGKRPIDSRKTRPLNGPATGS